MLTWEPVNHELIIRHADGESTTEAAYTDRAQAINEAYIIAARLHPEESVSVLGYTIGGLKE